LRLNQPLPSTDLNAPLAAFGVRMAQLTPLAIATPVERELIVWGHAPGPISDTEGMDLAARSDQIKWLCRQGLHRIAFERLGAFCELYCSLAAGAAAERHSTVLDSDTPGRVGASDETLMKSARQQKMTVPLVEQPVTQERRDEMVTEYARCCDLITRGPPIPEAVPLRRTAAAAETETIRRDALPVHSSSSPFVDGGTDGGFLSSSDAALSAIQGESCNSKFSMRFGAQKMEQSSDGRALTTPVAQADITLLAPFALPFAPSGMTEVPPQEPSLPLPPPEPPPYP
jgi:hypothetical protein